MSQVMWSSHTSHSLLYINSGHRWHNITALDQLLLSSPLCTPPNRWVGVAVPLCRLGYCFNRFCICTAPEHGGPHLSPGGPHWNTSLLGSWQWWLQLVQGGGHNNEVLCCPWWIGVPRCTLLIQTIKTFHVWDRYVWLSFLLIWSYYWM